MRALSVLILLFLLVWPMAAAAADPVSDDTLYDQVRIKLAADREVGGGNIEVKVSQGVVELHGKVKSDKIKTKSEKIAKKVKGVKQVVNRLVVSPV
jgi:osmotically-inducible protein OsmY